MLPPEKKFNDFAESATEFNGADYEAIYDLLEELRSLGFRFGTQQYVDLHRALIALTAKSKTAISEEKLKTYLAPVVCSTPTEQETFYAQFDNWLENRKVIKKTANAEVSALENNLPKHKVVIRPRRPLLWSFAFGLLTLLIISPAIYLYFFKIPAQDSVSVRGSINGQIVDEDTLAPLGGAEILFQNGKKKTDNEGKFILEYEPTGKPVDVAITHSYYPLKKESVTLSEGVQNVTIKLKKSIQIVEANKQVIENPINESSISKTNEHTNKATVATTDPAPVLPDYWKKFYRKNFYYLLAAAASIPFLYFCLWWFLRQRHRARLARKASDEIPPLNKLIVKGVTEILYKNSALRRAIQELRRHRPQDSTDLDVPATIDATINRGGLPQPVFGTRKTSPEYLILIDRANFSDQEALLKEVLINRLIEEGVYVDRYYFDGDPRVCYKSPKSETLSLPELAARYPEHNLAIFSDGASFLDPLTALPQRWLEMFSHWVRRAVLTPASLDSWSYREKVLSEAHFPVLPANKEGIAALVGVVNGGQMPKIVSNKTARQFPEILEERPLRWLDRHAPNQKDIDELYRQLRRYLDAEEFYLLCACAVYPALSLELTLYLGYKLGGEVERLEDELFSLVRLPWFRHGKMPDWLRQRLLSGLSAAQEKEIRTIIEQLLITAIENPSDGLNMEFAFDEESYKQGRKRLREFILGEPENSPLRDYVLLSFLSRSSRLSVALPEAVRRMLFPEGVHWLGIKPSFVFLLALLISLSATTTTALFLPLPSPEEADLPPSDINPYKTLQIPRNEPFLTYSPANAARGETIKLRFVSNSCEMDKLTNANLYAPETSGITVSEQTSSDCVYLAVVKITADAPLGVQYLTLTLQSNTSEKIQFMITDKPTKQKVPIIPFNPDIPQDAPTVVSLPKITTVGVADSTPSGNKIIDINCPDVLEFRYDSEYKISPPITLKGNTNNEGATFLWTVDSENRIFSIYSGQGTASITIKAEPSLVLVNEANLTIRMEYSYITTRPDKPFIPFPDNRCAIM